MNAHNTAPRTGPELIFETLNAYQRTAALKAAIALDLFTAIGAGAHSVQEIAARCNASERGIRMICDYLVVLGLLTKHQATYGLTPDSAKLLDRRSQSCIASTLGFLALPAMTDAFKDFAAVVRAGRPGVAGGAGTTGPEDPIWVEFARSMAPMQVPLAEALCKVIKADSSESWKVLDIGAGHGVFGICVAKHNPNAEIHAADWPEVLRVARENADAASISSRFHEIPGSAFEVEFGAEYDLILLVNFLQLFAPSAIEIIMRKVHAALKPNGRAVTLGFVPNEDRVSPSGAAAFGLIMLGTTVGGDAYPFCEYEKIFRRAGFASNQLIPLPAGPQSVIISRRY